MNHAMQRNLVIFCAILMWAIIVGCSGDGSSPVQPDETTGVSPAIVAWLQNHTVPFNTSKPGSGFEDLMPLKQIVGDARIVSLGEATHGTREFFEMKHRILEFLVKEMGFNTFAIEATWPESNLVNNYIQTGEGDPARLLAGLFFWTWNTQEVLDMILWMRENRVSFHGFDMPRLFLDLRGIDLSPESTNWLAGPRPFRSIGAVYDRTKPEIFFSQSRLPEEYDVIIYFQDTTPSTLLPFSGFTKAISIDF